MQVTKVIKAMSAVGLILFASVGITKDLSELPVPFVAKYDAFRHDNDIGSAQLSLIKTNNGIYELMYESKVSRFFLSDKRYETSTFSFKDGKITPIKYEFTRKGTGRNKSLSAKFEAGTNSIVLSDKTKLKWEGELDNQLFRIDISRQLAQEKAQFEYKFLNYRGQKRVYNIEVVEKEMLSLPYGHIEAIKVKVNRDTTKRQTYAWFAPSLDFVLVRLQQFKDGDEQGDIRLKSYERK